jgi:hypothetical protein
MVEVLALTIPEREMLLREHTGRCAGDRPV